jgi:hypothetical protein
MALSSSVMSAAIKAAIIAHANNGLRGSPTVAEDQALTALCDGIATGVVATITGSAVVIGTATGAMSGGPGVPIVGTVT